MDLEAKVGGMVNPGTAFPELSRQEQAAMAKRRHQCPYLEPMGQNWTIRLWKDVLKDGAMIRRRVRVPICPVKTPKREALKKRDRYLEGVNFTPPTLGASVTLQAFVTNVYEKIALPLLAKSHRDRYQSVLKLHILPALGMATMFDLEQQTNTLVEEFLIGRKDYRYPVRAANDSRVTPTTSLAGSEHSRIDGEPMLAGCVQRETGQPVGRSQKGIGRAQRAERLGSLGQESLKKIRSCGAHLFGVAITKGYALRNPFKGAALPPAKPTPKDKPVITDRQLEKLVELIPEPYATIVYVAAYTGLRVSEVLALKFNDVRQWTLMLDEKECEGWEITIDEKYCRGEWGVPKSEASRATIAVLRKVVSRIQSLIGMKTEIGGGRGGHQTFQVIKSTAPESLIFRGIRSGREMRDNNILTRFIKPAARHLGIGFVNWQCLRRSHATWLKRAGVPLKDASRQMRHAKIETTAEIYQMTPAEDQISALDKLEALTAVGRVN